MAPGREKLVDDLVRLVGVKLLDPLEVLLEGGKTLDVLRVRVRSQAGQWAERILSGDDQAALHTIVRLVSTLYPSDEPFDPPLDWWRTPTGQAVAWRIGHPTAEAVSYPVAGAMLGITRQGVHDLVLRGKLARHPDGGVRPSSIRDRLRQEGNPAHVR